MSQDYHKIQDDEFSINFILPENIEEEAMITKIIGYQKNCFKQIVYYFFCTMSLGFFWLICRWNIMTKIKYTMNMSKLSESSFCLVYCKDGTKELKPLRSQNLMINKIKQPYFTLEFRLFRYFFDPQINKFLPVMFQLNNITNHELHQNYGKGIKESDYEHLYELYGINSTQAPEKTTFKILVDEVLSPFYIFQVFSIVLWFSDDYEIYASVIFFTSMISIIITLIEARSNIKRLREMSKFSMNVKVIRQQNGIDQMKKSFMDQLIEINSEYLVPGDVIEIPENSQLPCDLILLNGSCIVNEAMLTGESVPIIKNALVSDSKKYNNEDYKSNILYCGTSCIETRFYMKGKYPILGLVVQTGFNTIKGQLVRSMLYPKELNFQFYKDSLRFIGVMCIFSGIGLIFSLWSLIHYGASMQYVIMKSLDMITGIVQLKQSYYLCQRILLQLNLLVTVPPALPTCMSIGISFALSTLKKSQIFCIQPNKVNVAGKINILCFDKTGTLTEEGLDNYGAVSVNLENRKFGEMVQPDQIKNMLNMQNKMDGTLHEVMACTHALTTVNDQLIGDPLDIKMFEATGWCIEDNCGQGKFDELVLSVVRPNMENYQSHLMSFQDISKSYKKSGNFKEILEKKEIGIMRRFEFSSKLQRMSVIVRHLNDAQQQFIMHTKGSPEKLRELCVPESIPENFHQILNIYTKSGFRVLACATKNLKISFRNLHKVERDQLEKDFTFVGFLIMENKLKDITKSIIMQLHKANLRTVMITGDNALTAISVARQCSIVQAKKRIYLGDLSEKKINGSFKLEWKDFDNFDQELDPQTLLPESKKPMVQEQQNDYSINMKSSMMSQEQVQENLITNMIEKELKKEKTKRKLSHNVDTKTEINQLHVNRLSLRKTSNDGEEQFRQSKIGDVPWLNQNNQEYTVALTGRAFSYLYKKHIKTQYNNTVFNKVLENAGVFARMKPEEKALLVQCLQQQNEKNIVSMCGDGANDCAALKQSDVGISLSQAEASIAAPFTSNIQDISCVINILREGRCALVTSFACFKFMILYSMVQFSTLVVLYAQYTNLSDFQFLYIDLILIFPLAIFMSMTKSSSKLSQEQPTGTLMSVQILSSVIGQVLIQISAQLTMFFILSKQKWFIKCYDLNVTHTGDDFFSCYEVTTLFCFSNFQYIFIAYMFSTGKPFRQPFYKNVPFFLTFLVLILSSTILLLNPNQYFSGLFSFIEIQNEWQIKCFLYAIVYAFVAMLYEFVFVPNLTYYHKQRKTRMEQKSIIDINSTI